MTVKELKAKLEQFPENCEVMIPDPDWRPSKAWPYVHVGSVTRGVNEIDMCVFIDDYVEKEDK